MAAIEQELATGSLATAEAPVIEISEAPAGRETLAAIAQELAHDMRPRQNTLPYADRISNAPGAKTPSRAPAPPRPARQSDAPEVIITADSEPPLAPRASTEGVEIFELLTFIVRGEKVGDLSGDAARRRFVEQHLLHRLPGASIASVDRIEVTPWTAKGTVVLRVWCRA